MSMKKHKFRSRNAQKRTPSTDLQNCIKTRSLLSLPVLLCARHACKNRSKSLKIYHKITTKSTNAVVAMARNARGRSTCEHASKRVDFCRSRCCFAHAMDAKIAQNRRKFTTKWPQKIRSPVLHWSKTRAVDRPAKMYRNAFIFVAPGVALLSPWMQNRSKSWKSAKLVQKLKNHQKNKNEIPKHHKECFKTWSKREKTLKIEKIHQ